MQVMAVSGGALSAGDGDIDCIFLNAGVSAAGAVLVFRVLGGVRFCSSRNEREENFCLFV